MAAGKVGRPPKGGVAKDRSETAERAYVAARLARRTDQDFLNGLQVALNRSALSRAGRRLLWHPPGYRPRGRSPSSGKRKKPATMRPLREWLQVDAAALNISAGLVMIECGSRRAQLDAFRDLTRLHGVTHLMRLVRAGGKYRLAALVLVDDENDRERLRARLDELCGEWSWEEIGQQTVAPALQTWQRLARLAADREGLRR